jgi:Lrp/AsnC family leucine-responsive transcriptional regulator
MPTDHDGTADQTSDSVGISSIDDRIIHELRRDGRTSYADLGRAVGLSAHAVGERVRRLVRSGVIKGFMAVVDGKRLGQGLEALVDVRLLPTAVPETFEANASKLETVREVVFVTGRFDYQVRVVCRDAEALDRTVRTLRGRGGAALTETRIVLRATAAFPEARAR